MKKIGYLFISIGVLAAIFFVFADSLGSGSDRGLGAAQLLGMQIGVFLILLGLGLIGINWDKDHKFNERISTLAGKFINWPVIVWILAPFIVEFVIFSISPMFFAKTKVQYFTKYIPDAYITHIGFDIESTVSRIGNWLVTGQSPYADGFLLYAPFVFVLFAPLIILGYPAYYKLMVMVSLFSYFITFIISVLIIPKKNYSLLLLFLIAGLFSYGFQFELERGQFNVIALASTLVAIYIFHYHHRYRYFAFLLFSLAIQLKLYPAIFIFMFVNDWRKWRDIFRRFLGLGLLNFSLFFILGYSFFTTFLAQVTGYQLNYQSSRAEDMSMTGFVNNLTTDGFGLLKPATLAKLTQYSGLIEATFLVLFGLSLLSVIAYAYLKKQTQFNPYLLLVCTIGAMIIPSQSADYKLSILIVPLAVVLSSLPVLVERRKKIAQIALLLITSTAYWLTFYPAKYKPYVLSRNFPALFVILIAITILHYLVDGKVASVPDNSTVEELAY